MYNTKNDMGHHSSNSHLTTKQNMYNTNNDMGHYSSNSHQNKFHDKSHNYDPNDITTPTQFHNNDDESDDDIPINELLKRKQQAASDDKSNTQAASNDKCNTEKRPFDMLSSQGSLPSTFKMNKTQEDSSMSKVSQLLQQDEPNTTDTTTKQLWHSKTSSLFNTIQQLILIHTNHLHILHNRIKAYINHATTVSVDNKWNKDKIKQFNWFFTELTHNIEFMLLRLKHVNTYSLLLQKSELSQLLLHNEPKLLLQLSMNEVSLLHQDEPKSSTFSTKQLWHSKTASLFNTIQQLILIHTNHLHIFLNHIKAYINHTTTVSVDNKWNTDNITDNIAELRLLLTELTNTIHGMLNILRDISYVSTFTQNNLSHEIRVATVINRNRVFAFIPTDSMQHGCTYTSSDSITSSDSMQHGCPYTSTDSVQHGCPSSTSTDSVQHGCPSSTSTDSVQDGYTYTLTDSVQHGCPSSTSTDSMQHGCPYTSTDSVQHGCPYTSSDSVQDRCPYTSTNSMQHGCPSYTSSDSVQHGCPSYTSSDSVQHGCPSSTSTDSMQHGYPSSTSSDSVQDGYTSPYW
jgi:hypothetical protein